MKRPFCYQGFLLLLRKAQERRPELQEWTPDGPSWIAYEGKVMLDAVNVARRSCGKSSVTMRELRALESTACGHVDYTEKFALICAELASKD